MKPIDIETLASVLHAAVPDGASLRQITGVCIDSRVVGEGDCFFALRGPNFDGHDFVADAFAAGAVCAVVGAGFDMDRGQDMPLVRVDDTVRALGELGRWYRNDMSFKVVAITGSAGKTTTREIVYHVLKGRFRCVRAMKSFNNEIGLPLTLLAADEGCEIVIAELGSNRIGEMGHLTAIAQPDIAVVLNIYPAHLEGFGSIEAITKEKASISEGLKAGGKLLINGDFPGLAGRCEALGREFTTFGRGGGCDIRAIDAVSTGPCGTLTIDDTVVSVPLPGEGNLDNTLAAWAVCREFGVSVGEFGEAVKTADPVGMRLDIQKAGSLTIINDCYNANPASMANALDCLGQIAAGGGGGEAPAGRSVLICGSMGELGDESGALHVQIGVKAADRGVELILAAGPFAAEVAEGANNSGENRPQAHVFENTGQLCDNLQRFVLPDDIILVKGSRSAGLEQAVDRLVELFG